jgi:hypothetical protein
MLFMLMGWVIFGSTAQWRSPLNELLMVLV